MARIPDTEVQRLKDEVAVQRLVEAAGIELKKVGKDFAARCPFHADDTASLIVIPSNAPRCAPWRPRWRWTPTTGPCWCRWWTTTTRP